MFCDEEGSWCPGAESNHRHCDFQSHALPTELPGHAADRRSAEAETGLIGRGAECVQRQFHVLRMRRFAAPQAGWRASILTVGRIVIGGGNG
jgi:hypothetical protein